MRSRLKYFALGDVRLQSGSVLHNANLAYQTYGKLNADASNAVLLPTFYTGTHERNVHLFGPGRAIDPAHHFVISVNMFGNGWSSSPSNAVPSCAGPLFPDVTLYDNVVCQHRLLTEHLRVQSLALVAGWSMAGCQAYHWAAMYPEMVRAIVPYCASARTSVHNIVFLEGVKAALQADITWNDGAYLTPPEHGLRAFGRVYAGWAYSQAFFRRGLYRTLGFKSHEDLLVSWEEDHLTWDANNLLAKLWSWQHSDISHNPRYKGNIEHALASITSNAILIPSRTDLYFTPEDNLIELTHLPNAEVRIYDTDMGHCGCSPGVDSSFDTFLDDCIRSVMVETS